MHTLLQVTDPIARPCFTTVDRFKSEIDITTDDKDALIGEF